jgi:hypothetical protein
MILKYLCGRPHYDRYRVESKSFSITISVFICVVYPSRISLAGYSLSCALKELGQRCGQERVYPQGDKSSLLQQIKPCFEVEDDLSEISGVDLDV